MKKLLGLIILLVIIFSCVFYLIYAKYENEEIQVLNADVSVNNVKSIIDLEDEINNDYEEIPLGYNDGSIYLIKYDSVNKKLYDNNIFILNKDGTTNECGIKLPDNYLSGELSVYGDKIFGRDGYFNWKSGKEYKLLSDEDDTMINNWYSVSGNSDYYLCVESNAQNKKYILYNTDSNDKYEFDCVSDSDDVINGIFYDNVSENFYAMCKNNVVKEIHINKSDFTLEKYDDIKVMNKDDIDKSKDVNNNYIYCSEGQAYIGLDYNDNSQESVNISQYDIANKFTEQLNNITLYGYDSFYKEYILIKKDDDKSSNKIYLAKFEKNGFDMLVEIPKVYDDSTISIHMVDSENVLVKEESYDKENRKIKNRYIVYDLTQYFEENTNKSKNDNDKLTLKNTYKNINEFNDYDSNNKNKLIDQNKNTEEAESTPKDNTSRDTIQKDNGSNTTGKEERDYREYDSSWRKGNGDWYYYKSDDEKAIGWVKTQKGWYYFYKDGIMQKDAIVLGKNRKEYILGHDGLVLNPDSGLNNDYDGSKENTNKENNNNSNNTNKNNNGEKDTNNLEKNSNASNGTKDKQSTNDKAQSKK